MPFPLLLLLLLLLFLLLLLSFLPSSKVTLLFSTSRFLPLFLCFFFPSPLSLSLSPPPFFQLLFSFYDTFHLTPHPTHHVSFIYFSSTSLSASFFILIFIMLTGQYETIFRSIVATNTEQTEIIITQIFSFLFLFPFNQFQLLK